MFFSPDKHNLRMASKSLKERVLELQYKMELSISEFTFFFLSYSLRTAAEKDELPGTLAGSGSSCSFSEPGSDL